MLIIIGLILMEVLLDYLLRRKNLRRVHNVITVLIWVLLLILGVEIGENGQIIRGLHTVGIEVIILTLGGTLGSVTAAQALQKALYKKEGEVA